MKNLPLYYKKKRQRGGRITNFQTFQNFCESNKKQNPTNWLNLQKIIKEQGDVPHTKVILGQIQYNNFAFKVITVDNPKDYYFLNI